MNLADDQLDLFTERECRALGAPPRPNSHGVYEPDETLELVDAKRGQVVCIDLVHVPTHGWLYAYHYSLEQCGAGFAPSLKWSKFHPVQPCRRDAINAAKGELRDRISDEYHGAKPGKLGMLALRWLTDLPA